MANQQILSYIKNSFQEGIDRESIKSALLRAGWQEQDAEEALRAAESPVAPESPAPLTPEKQSQSALPMSFFHRWLPVSAGVLIILLVIGGFVVWRHFAQLEADRKDRDNRLQLDIRQSEADIRDRDHKRQGDIRQIAIAMELCRLDLNCGGGENQYIATPGGLNAITAIRDPVYIENVPKDPLDTPPYQYIWLTNDNLQPVDDYCLYARLEKASATKGNVIYLVAGSGGVKEKDLSPNFSFSLTDCE